MSFQYFNFPDFFDIESESYSAVIIFHFHFRITFHASLILSKRERFLERARETFVLSLRSDFMMISVSYCDGLCLFATYWLMRQSQSI